MKKINFLGVFFWLMLFLLNDQFPWVCSKVISYEESDDSATHAELMYYIREANDDDQEEGHSRTRSPLVVPSLSPQLSVNNRNSSASSPPPVRKFRLASSFQVECPRTQQIKAEKFEFDRIMFNRSVYSRRDDAAAVAVVVRNEATGWQDWTLVKSEAGFEAIFGRIDRVWPFDNVYKIENAKFDDSGKYFCVYSRQHDAGGGGGGRDREFLVNERINLVYDGRTY
jgi:hypothetical protein